MRILYTISSFNIGGTEKFLCNIVNYWADDDEIFLCIINKNNSDILLSTIQSKVKIIYLKEEEYTEHKRYAWKYISFIKKYKIDIINCFDKNGLIISSLVKTLLPRIKVYYTYHDVIKEDLKEELSFCNKYSIRKNIVLFNSVKKILIDNQIKEKNIEVLNNGVDVDIYKEYKRRGKKKYPKIGCINSMVPDKKGQEVLIHAISKVKEKNPNVKAYFLDDFREENKMYLYYITRLIKRLDLVDNIVFIGGINNVHEFLKEIDILVVPSKIEGYGFSILEGLAAKVPVIVSNNSCSKEIIKENKYGILYNCNDYKELGEDILNCIMFKNDEIIDAAYNYVKSNYNINVTVQRLRRIYLL